MICETLAIYYNQLNESPPEPTFGSDTDLGLHAPIGAYALSAVAVRTNPVLAPTCTQTVEWPRCDAPCECIPLVNTLLPSRGSTK